MLKCPKCEKSFRSKNALYGHLRVHNTRQGSPRTREVIEKPPLVCQCCLVTFFRKKGCEGAKYCSTKCASDYRWNTTKAKILHGEVFGFDVMKKYIIEVTGYKCVECGVTDTWNSKPITLHLDHVDGDSDNNKLGNLRLLCPNCHSQTDTFCGRNIKKTQNVLNMLDNGVRSLR